MNKPLNLVVSKKFNENNSSEDHKDTKHNKLQNIYKTNLREKMSLKRSNVLCKGKPWV